MSKQSQAQPRQRFEIERDRHGLLCSRPVGVGEAIKVREDRAVAADIEAVAKAIAEDDERESWDGLWENQAEQDAAGQERGEPNRDDYRHNARAALAARTFYVEHSEAFAAGQKMEWDAMRQCAETAEQQRNAVQGYEPARAIYEDNLRLFYGGKGPKWEHLDESQREGYRSNARVAVAALPRATRDDACEDRIVAVLEQYVERNEEAEAVGLSSTPRELARLILAALSSSPEQTEPR